jgi:hypothetical protein
MPNKTWASNPTVQGQDYITIADVVGIGTYTTTSGNTTNSITINLGSSFNSETVTSDALLFQPAGLMAIPPACGTYDSNGNFTAGTSSATSAQAVAYIRNDQWIILGLRDTRTQNQVGNAQPGDVVLYALQGQARCALKSDGSVNLITTTTNDATGQVIQLSLTPTGLYFNAPWGKIAFDAAGFRVSTSSGASINAYGSSNPTSGNGVTISGGSVSLQSSMVLLGTSANIAPFPVVYGLLPATAPGIPILGEGVGVVTVNASSATGVFVGV